LDREDVANLCCDTEEETSVHVLCECEALASFRHIYLGSFFLNPKDIKSLSLGAIWNFSKRTGLPRLSVGLWGTKGLFSGLHASGLQGLKPKYYSNSNSNY